MSQDFRIGFLGLGGMGRGIVKNLIEKGHPVRVFDRNPAAVESAAAFGAQPAAGVGDISAHCNVLMLSVSTAEDVKGLLLGPDGALRLLPSGAFVVDHTTTNPQTVSDLAIACDKAGLRFVEAPVTRTPKHAWLGQLNVLLGASAENRDALTPLFKCYCENIFHVGAVGHAIRLKLIHNYVGFANMAAWCEGLALAKKDGVDLNMLHQVISTGGANSGMFQIYAMQVLNGDFAPAMSLINAQKDVDYYRHWAEESGLSPALAEAVLGCFARAAEAGFGEQGVQAVIRPMEAELGVEARLN